MAGSSPDLLDVMHAAPDFYHRQCYERSAHHATPRPGAYHAEWCGPPDPAGRTSAYHSHWWESGPARVTLTRPPGFRLVPFDVMHAAVHVDHCQCCGRSEQRPGTRHSRDTAQERCDRRGP